MSATKKIKKSNTFNNIIGKRVVAIKGCRADLRISVKAIDPEFILFDDGETLIELEDQDYYSYCCCDTSARTVKVIIDKDKWQRIMDDDEHYPYTAQGLLY